MGTAASLLWTKRSDHGDFIIAAANGDAEKCLAIINRAPGTPFAPFDERERPLFTDEDHAAQLNMVDPDTGHNALMHCAEKGMVDVITALLDHVQKIPEEETSPSRRRRRRRKKKEQAPPPTFLAVDATTPGGGETALHLAAAADQVGAIDALMSHLRFKQELCDAVDAQGHTALLVAVGAGHAEAVAALLARRCRARPRGTQEGSGSDEEEEGEEGAEGGAERRKKRRLKAVDATERHGRTALHVAAFDGLAPVVAALLDGLPADACNAATAAHGRTALHFAAVNGRAECVRLLVEHDSFHAENAVDVDGQTSLHRAASNGHPDACQALLDAENFRFPDAKTTHGFNALQLACHYGRPRCVAVLCQHPKFWSYVDDCFLQSGDTALHIAASDGRAQCCQVMLDEPTFTLPDAVNCNKANALHMAAYYGHAAACKVLMAHPRFTVATVLVPPQRKYQEPYVTGLECVDAMGRTALDIAMEKNHVAAAEVLRNENFAHPKGPSFVVELLELLVAARRGDQKRCFEILARREHLLPEVANAADGEGWTACHWASRKGMTGVCTTLLSHPSYRKSLLNPFSDGKTETPEERDKKRAQNPMIATKGRWSGVVRNSKSRA